jgi:hypothetical protein
MWRTLNCRNIVNFLNTCLYEYSRTCYFRVLRITQHYTEGPKSLELMEILFIFYYLRHMLYMFTPTLYDFFSAALPCLC